MYATDLRITREQFNLSTMHSRHVHFLNNPSLKLRKQNAAYNALLPVSQQCNMYTMRACWLCESAVYTNTYVRTRFSLGLINTRRDKWQYCIWDGKLVSLHNFHSLQLFYLVSKLYDSIRLMSMYYQTVSLYTQCKWISFIFRRISSLRRKNLETWPSKYVCNM